MPLSLLVININPSASTRNGTRRIVRALSALSPAGSTVRERHYARLRAVPDDVDGIVIGPQGVPFDTYPEIDRAHLFGLLRKVCEGAPLYPGAPGAPVLGICGGHQALALAFGGALAPVHGGIASGTYTGLRKETGLRRVVATNQPDLLAPHLPGDYIVSHVEGVSRLPDAFLLAGRGDPCPVQLIRHRERLAWGVQFHPERGGDGAAFLRAWLAIVAR